MKKQLKSEKIRLNQKKSEKSDKIRKNQIKSDKIRKNQFELRKSIEILCKSGKYIIIKLNGNSIEII